MTKEVAKKEETALAMPEDMSFGMEESGAANLLIPRIMCVQNTSKMIVKLKAQQGDMRESLGGKCLAKVTEPLEFIPLYFYDTWFHSKIKDKQFVFDSISDRKNDGEFEYLEKDDKGVEVAKHEKCINAFVLLPADIEKNGAAALPHLLSFRGAQTYKEAGQKLTTLCEILRRQKDAAGNRLGPASRVFMVTSAPYTNAKGQLFYVLDVKEGRATTKEEIQAAYSWYLQISKNRKAIRVDDEGLKEETEETTNAEGKF